MSCNFCDRKFNDKSNKLRHEKNYCFENPDRIKLKREICNICKQTFSNINNLKYHHKHYCRDSENNTHILNTKLKKKPVIKRKNKFFELHFHMYSEGKDSHNFIRVENNLLAILINKMGPDDGIDFLLGNFLTLNYSKILEKVYFDGKGSDNFPIACKGGGHFRFINKNGILVDDKNGNIICKQILNNIQAAGLMASNLLIKKFSDSKDYNDLYDVYDIGQIQNVAYKMDNKSTITNIKKYLSKRVLNPNHPHFLGNHKQQILEK